MKINVNKQLKSVGSKVTFYFDRIDLFSKLISVVERIDSLNNSIRLSRKFIINLGDNNWGAEIDLNESNIQSIDCAAVKEIQFIYTVVENLIGSPITINCIELIGDLTDPDPISPFNAVEIIDTTGHNFHSQVSDSLHGLNTAINRWINRSTGVDVLYLRTTPDKSNIDHILREYSTYKSVGKFTKFRIVIPDGAIPNPSENEINEFGLDLSMFEIHIDPLYFRQIFGADSSPRQEDVILFDQFNMIYRVKNCYMDRLIGNKMTYWVCKLSKFDINQSIDGDIKQMVEVDENMIINDEQHLLQEIIDSEDKISNDQLYSMKTLADDILREEIDDDMVIDTTDVMNNGSLLMKNSYDLRGIQIGYPAVLYKPEIELNSGGSISISMWVRPHSLDTRFMPQILSQQMVGYNKLQLQLSADVNDLMFDVDSIYLSGMTLDVHNVDGDKIVVLHDRLLDHLLSWSIADKINLIKSDNLSVDIINRSLLRVRYGLRTYDLNGVNLPECQWSGVVVNISNSHKLIGFYQWSIQDNSTVDRGSTRLLMSGKKEIQFKGDILIGKSSPSIWSSNSNIGGIRIWKKSIPLIDQSMAISTIDVKNMSLLYLIDNCDRVFNTDVIGRGNTYNTERNDKTDNP